MADNRIWLCYKLTGRVIMLGKKLGVGYFKPPDEEKMQRFFDACEKDAFCEDPLLHYEETGDDFILLKESDGNFEYGKDWLNMESPDQFVLLKELINVL